MNTLKLFVSVYPLFVCFNSGNSILKSGFYSKDLDHVTEKFEIVYPEKVSKDGSFVSYYLPSYYNIESFENRPRRTGTSRSAQQDEVHFFVPIDGEVYQLELTPNWNFIAPGLIVERRDPRDVQNVNKAKLTKISQRQCHYSGRIVEKPNSSVALSTCNGLAGFIKVPSGDEYFIEPAKDSRPSHEKEHPHIIYKRSGPKNKPSSSNCLTKGSAKEALAERLKWESMFGDQIRKEMAGVNFNDLVQEQVRKPAKQEYLNENSLSDSNILNPIYPKLKNNKIPKDKNIFDKKTVDNDQLLDEGEIYKNNGYKFVNKGSPIKTQYKKGPSLKLVRRRTGRSKREVQVSNNDKQSDSNSPTQQNSLFKENKKEPLELNLDLNSIKPLQNYFEHNYDINKFHSPNGTEITKENFKADDKLINTVLESVAKEINHPKVKKQVLSDTSIEDKNVERLNAFQIPTINKITQNGDKETNEKSSISSFNIDAPTHFKDNDYKVSPVKNYFENTLGDSSKSSDEVSLFENKPQREHLGGQIVIQIKSTGGVESDKNKVGTDSFKNLERKVNLPISKLKNKLTYKADTENGINEINKSEQLIKGKGLKFNENVLPVQEQGQQNCANDFDSKIKTKRNVTVQVKPESNINSSKNLVSNEDNKNFFCNGKNCLDIRPVILNDAKYVNSSSDFKATGTHFNNKNGNITSTGMLKKRQVWPDDCTVIDQTTEQNLVCFDLYNKMFNIELMITVDYKVIKMHGDDDIENFVLTIINMVATNFFDGTLGINLSVFLVRLILLTTCIKELDSDQFNPEELLENFCTWQVLINPGNDDHPHHHDLAIFITRMDKCQGQVLGVTYMTSICRPDKSCIVCVDEGLMLANTITHQIGHALGAEHDENESSGCPSIGPNGNLYFMAPTISETSSAWSVCSRDTITQFLKIQGSWCLSDLPVERQFNFPLILPGQIYSAAQQCKLNFHMTALPCSVGPFCDKLYCQVTDKLCATKGDPPADGTFCAADMWCFQKQCVHLGRRPGAVNGEWGPWTEWSLCTRSCGGGVSSSYRICNNPKPLNGGRYCVGNRIRHRMCYTTPCIGFTDSFRDLQCKKTEDKPFRGRLHNWMQYHSFFTNIECALVCKNKKGDIVMRSPIVADGTPCKAGTRNVCIQGACRNVGCDWVIDSNAKEDSCGVCQGNGTECTVIQGVFEEPAVGKSLVEFLRIPKGSGMIFVRELAPSKNTIVVSGAINHVFYLNGQGAEDSMPGDITLGEVHGVYEIRSQMERIFARGPTTEDLIFYIQFREPNKGVHYQYAIPQIDPTYAARYLWQYLDWDPCTDPCSGGSQRAHAKCVEDRGGVVDDQYCVESSRPMDIIRPCNDFPCKPKWWVSVWSDCICTGSSSIMFRSVLCMRATDESGTRSEIVKESECAAHKKPVTQKPCNVTLDDENECPAKRSTKEFKMPRSLHRSMRMAVNPKNAFSEFVPNSANIRYQERGLIADNSSAVKDVKNSSNTTAHHEKDIKSKLFDNVNDKEISNKLPTKSLALQNDQSNKVVFEKIKEADSLQNQQKDTDSNKELEVDAKYLPIKEGQNNLQFAGNDKDSVEPRSNDVQDIGNCSTTDDCETSTASTCRLTCAVKSHKKTTCCKKAPKVQFPQPPESTTMRPVNVNLDELILKNFAITVIPLDNSCKNKEKLPLTDPEFIMLGNIGQFNVADETNGTIITGQEALDFLDFARSNISQELNVQDSRHN